MRCSGIVDVKFVKADDICGASNFLRAGERCPVDSPILEPTEAPRARRTELVGDGISKKAAFPAEGSPLVPNGSMHLMGARLRGPVDRTTLEVVVAPDTIGRRCLISKRIAEEAAFPA